MFFFHIENALFFFQLEQELDEVNHQLCVFKDTKQFDVERVEGFKIEKLRLHERLAELKKNGIELRRLIATMNVENKNATREMMAKLQTCFKYLYRRIIDCAGSSGDLKLRTAGAANNENGETEELEIFCTFTGEDHAGKEFPFDQLTLKHKTIVALIFILAVLQSSPYTLYLLDHIDEVRLIHFDTQAITFTSYNFQMQDIDEQYRLNIAEYIEERSNVSQFFVAASHTELLATSENLFEFTASVPHHLADVKRIRPIEIEVDSPMDVC